MGSDRLCGPPSQMVRRLLESGGFYRRKKKGGRGWVVLLGSGGRGRLWSYKTLLLRSLPVKLRDVFTCQAGSS